MRRLIRWVDETGEVTVGVERDVGAGFFPVLGTSDPIDVLRSETFEVGPEPIVPEDAETLALGRSRRLLAPLDPPEVWCSGVTYQRSRDARMEESAVRDVYDLVYDAERPELFLKDAGGRRTAGPGAPVGVRSDSSWNVPEPELGLVLDSNGTILAHTLGNDVSSRAIEGANPLYLSQAKVYAGSCAIGPALVPAAATADAYELEIRITSEHGELLYEDATSTAQMVRTFEGLASWLVRDNPVPTGTVLLTGTGLVPPDDFTLEPGHTVAISASEIGTLVNTVVPAATLVVREPQGVAR